jgi:SAM-dependent methyltransferase
LWTSPGSTAAGAFDSADDYRRNDVYAHTARLAPLVVRVDCGTGDPFYASVKKFVGDLHPAPQGTFGSGFHDDAYWRSVAPPQIQTIRRALKQPWCTADAGVRARDPGPVHSIVNRSLAGMQLSREHLRMNDESRLDRFKAGVCRRSFSSPEAFAYEFGIAPALCRIVSPLVAARVTDPPVLDVGCGGGRLSLAIASAVRGSVTAVDPSRSQVRRVARRSGRSRAAFAVQSWAEWLPFSDSSFGAVFSSCAMKHWRDPERGLAECVRVARLNAPVVVVEIDRAATTNEVRTFARATRVPPGLREAYVRFAMRTVVGVAPDRQQMLDLFGRAGLAAAVSEKVDGLPFLVTHARAAWASELNRGATAVGGDDRPGDVAGAGW